MEENRLHQGDCVAGMNAMPEGVVDLAFADPPFNIGYTYDVYEDRRAADEYLEWTRQWGGAWWSKCRTNSVSDSKSTFAGASRAFCPNISPPPLAAPRQRPVARNPSPTLLSRTTFAWLACLAS